MPSMPPTSPRGQGAQTPAWHKAKLGAALLVVLGVYHLMMKSMLGSFGLPAEGQDGVRYVLVSLGDAVATDLPKHAASAAHSAISQKGHSSDNRRQDAYDAVDQERKAETPAPVKENDEYEALELDLSFDEQAEASETKSPVVAPKKADVQDMDQDQGEGETANDGVVSADSNENVEEKEESSDNVDDNNIDDDDSSADDVEQEKEEDQAEETESEDVFSLTGHVLPNDILDERSELLDESDNDNDAWSGFAVNDEALAEAPAKNENGVELGSARDVIPVDLTLLKPADILCKDVSSKARCGEIPHCYWGTDTRSCRTELWAMECSMTKVKSTCAKLPKCTWASHSRSRGRYCVENMKKEEEEEVADAIVDLIDPNTTPCYKVPTQDGCDQIDRCFWNTEVKACRTEPWAMTCNMTKVRSTCGKIPNCRWASSRKTKGRYCVSISGDGSSTVDALDSSSDGDAASAVASSYADASDDAEESLAPHLTRVRIGNTTHLLTQCKTYAEEGACAGNTHCYWKEGQCLTEMEFLPCSSTKVRPTCDALKHCIWTAKTLTKGKYCVDRYYLDNPEELGTKCSILRSKTKCETQLACEWRSAKTTGRYCDRVVNLKEAARELHEIFPRYEDGLVLSPPAVVPITLTDAPSRPNRYECPKNLECQDPGVLAPQLSVAPSFLTSTTGFKVSRCCDAHDEILKMMRAVTTHFMALSFSDWWLDEGLALGMYRFNGVMPPWLTSPSVSVAHKSARSIRSLLDKFNKGFFYRPYSIRGCEIRTSKSKRKSSSSVASGDDAGRAVEGVPEADLAALASQNEGLAAPGASSLLASASSSTSLPASRYSCKSLSKISSKHTIVYYEVVNMNEPEAAKLRIYPRVTSRAARKCVSGPKNKPVPLDFVLPTKPCPHSLYGNDKVLCPHLPEAYLDLLYTPQWRTDPLPEASALRMPNVAMDDDVDIDFSRTTSESTLSSKFVWLSLRHCAASELQ
ncbi:Hypothetical Protein FCC1311_030372 [Hondaea fermentalgiana]|uniref:Uncharacterized protein n=1 Tax=Hondaea fermentalgiana TaxID=2315210 RepID=A0A2R5G8E4_9STRA|nr:Hypothetical Protein FCC1311_030372 [Hondaea fermentalgiana]|eukprot:GBG26815.1 Hypothetical Protein FCC1311_030372 [Hondaea fermentalgiana]